MSEAPNEDQPVILATNVISELARREPDPAVVTHLRAISHRSYLTTVILGELHLGVELCPEGSRKRELRHHVDAVREAYRDRTIPFTADAAAHYAASVAQLKRQGVTMTVNDAYIAATAATHGAVLCTRNVKDFEYYPNLLLQDPWT